MRRALNDSSHKFAQLRAAYVAQLRGKIDELAAAIEAIEQAPEASEMLTLLYQGAHRLAGSGSTYGLPEVSQAARQLEQLAVMLRDPANQAAAYVPELRTVLAQLYQAASRAPAAEERALPSIHPRPAPGSAAERRVMLVQNDPEQAEEITIQLRNFGYTVEYVPELTGLADAVRRERPAALIIDLLLPDGQLIETGLIAALQQELTDPLPVIFTSHRTDMTARLHAVRAGGHSYFSKPVDISSLVNVLDELTGAQPPEPYRVLIVDDSPLLAETYAMILEGAGMITCTVSDPLTALEPLAMFQPDLALIDMYMPGCTGPELAAVIRQQGMYIGLPIVFLSGEHDRDVQLVALQTGADDFLTKPIAPDHLIKAVTSRMQRARILRAQMIHDGLTGLLSHTAIATRLEHELRQAQRLQAPLAVAMIDIDHFKQVNDTYGHQNGDRVLKSLARLLKGRLRATDSVGRYGGEEFIVIMPGSDSANAQRVLDTFRTMFAQIDHHSDQHTWRVTLSAGVAAFPEYTEPGALIGAADAALYAAKRAGRNRVLRDGQSGA